MSVRVRGVKEGGISAEQRISRVQSDAAVPEAVIEGEGGVGGGQFEAIGIGAAVCGEVSGEGVIRRLMG